MNNTNKKIFRNYKILGYLLVFSLLNIVCLPSASGQVFYQTISNRSSILVKGTSNLHDWESKTQGISGELLASAEKNQINKIESVVIKIPVTSIKSDKNAMDSKTYEALNSKMYPVITYQSKNIKLSGNEITCTGELTINGLTKSKVIKSTYAISPDGIISVKGNAKLKMTEFDVKPPTALFGTLKAGNDLEVQFELSFQSAKKQ
jgi:polyisoprenoid-binding protein YceI